MSRRNLLWLLVPLALAACDRRPVAPEVVSTPAPTVAPVATVAPTPVAVETPDADGFISAVDHVKVGTWLYYHGHRDGRVTAIKVGNTRAGLQEKTVFWEADGQEQIYPMAALVHYRVRPDGQ